MAESKAVHTIETDAKTGAKTITLSEPIKIGGESVTSLTLRRPFARDLRQVFTKDATERFSMQVLMMNMAAKLASISDDEMDAIPLSDAVKIIELVDSFQQGAPTTSSLM